LNLHCLRSLQVLVKCKIPIKIGDEYGPFRVVAFTTTKDKKTKTSCAWDDEARAAEIDRMVAARAVMNKASALASDGGSDGDNTGTDSAAIALGVVGAALIVLVAVGAAHFLKRSNPQQQEAAGGGYEVDLDARQVRRVDSAK
jgi:hypothetical protein